VEMLVSSAGLERSSGARPQHVINPFIRRLED
jgi:hypothetical protein